MYGNCWNTRNRILALFFVGLLVIPPAVSGRGETQDDGAGPRGDYSQAAPVVLELKESGNLFTNSSFNFSLPANSDIISASLELEGMPVLMPVASHTCDFNQPDSTNHSAYKGSYGQNGPGSAAPNTFATTAMSASEITAISTSNNKYATYSVIGYPSPYGFQEFKFRVPYDNLAKSTVTWEGYIGESWSGIGTATAYIWNDTQKAWETVGTGSQSPDITFTKEFFGPGYRDPDGYLYVLAFCTVGASMFGEYVNSVNTDYVKVVVQGGSDNYPKNPSMDIGGNGVTEWSLNTARFDYCVTVEGVNLVAELEKLVKADGPQYVDLVVKFSSETAGKIKVSNFTVVYNAPPWGGVIPNTYEIDEDTVAAKLIDLNDYFHDPDDGDWSTLNYTVVYEEDSGKLDAGIDPDGHHMNFTPAANWWGKLRFRVRATDTGGLFLDSNNFTVTVRSVNDAPVLAPIGDQTAVQGVLWQLQVMANDVDDILDPPGTITYADNTSLFDIDPETGEASFTPTQDQVGTYFIQITATDREGAMDWENFTLVVQDAEDPPVLEPIPDQYATAGQAFGYTAKATDPDIPYGDSLSFSDDCPLFQIDAVSGQISFTPGAGDVGSYNITITVNDTRGGSDSKRFTLTINGSGGTVNHPPGIEPVSDQTASEGVLFEYTIKASDPDLGAGDALSFSDDCPLFDIGPSTGRISFTPARRDVGVYNVTVTVRDRQGLCATARFRLTVVKVNHPPVISSMSPANGTKVMQNDRVTFSVNASDPDGDPLNVTWKEGSIVVGYGATMWMNAGKTGTHVLTVVVSDGQLQATRETSFLVEETTLPRVDLPVTTDTLSMPFILAVIILAVVFLLGGLLLRRRLGKQGY